jgi:hypothetical protein
MPIIKAEGDIAPEVLALHHALRGKIPLEDWTRRALMIGLGHLLDEATRQHREKIYQDLAMHTYGHQEALKLFSLDTDTPNHAVAPARLVAAEP